MLFSDRGIVIHFVKNDLSGHESPLSFHSSQTGANAIEAFIKWILMNLLGYIYESHI